MRNILLSFIAIIFSGVAAFGNEVGRDSVPVDVTVEVFMPDSTWVFKHSYRMLPKPFMPGFKKVLSGNLTVADSLRAESLMADSLNMDSSRIQMPQTAFKKYVASPKFDPRRVKFSWGAEFASSIDLSGHDMSSIDFSAYFGLRYRWLNLAGVGAGVNIMVSNSCRTYPIFAVFRTDFSPIVKIMFLELRGGMALNYLPDNVSQQAPYASASVGFNLARSSKFRSYILAGYTYISRKDVVTEDRTHDYSSLSMASIRLGVAF